MTFSLAAKCRRSGMFGLAIATSSMAVGSRCGYARAGVGAALSQHRTDPRLGLEAIDLMSRGKSARDVIDRLVAQDPKIGWRQLAVVDRTGATAFHHGSEITSIHSAAQGDGCVAIGNILAAVEVPERMIQGFELAPSEHLAERLLRGLEAGLAAGGEVKQVKSAALLVVERERFPLVDLRVDLDPQAVMRLRYLWELYDPMIVVFANRVFAPEREQQA